MVDPNDTQFGGAQTGFGDWQATTSGAGTTPESNTDGDNLSDLLEYALGGNPSTGVPVMPLRPTECVGLFLTETATGTVDAKYTRPTGRPDVSYTIEKSTNLTAWTNAGLTGTVVNNGDSTETVTFTNVDGGTAGGFLRIRVTQTSGGAASAATRPAGWCANTLAGRNQTFGCPFITKAIYVGTVTSTGASSVNVTDSGDVRTLFASGKAYYIEFTSGTAEGHRIDVVTASSSSQSLALNLASVRNTTSTIPAGAVGSSFELRAHNTLGELLPKAKFRGATGFGNADQVQAWTGTGFSTYYLLDARPGAPQFYHWASQGSTTTAESTVVAPAQGVFVRHANLADTQRIICTGEVRNNDFIYKFSPGQNLISGAYPIPESGADRAWTIANGFRGTTAFTSSDQILVWRADADTAQSGYSTYYMLNGGNPSFQYWSIQGGAVNHNATKIFTPCRANFIRITAPAAFQVKSPAPVLP